MARVLDAVRSPPGAALAGIVVVVNAAIVAAASAIVMIFMGEAPNLFSRCRTEAARSNRMHDNPVSAQ